MGLKDYYYKLKILISKLIKKEDIRPKVHKKKMQLQLDDAEKKFMLHYKKLGEFLTQQPPSPIKSLGEQLYNHATVFINDNVIEMNNNRINNLKRSLVHPADFSMWVLYEMYSYTEEIYHYLQLATIGVPS